MTFKLVAVLPIKELITFFGMVVSVQIVICFSADHVVLVNGVFLERKPAQLADNYGGSTENILQSKPY